MTVCMLVSVCLSVRAIKAKRLELSALKSVNMAGPVHALTLRSKDQRSRSRSYHMGLQVDTTVHFSVVSIFVY